MSDAPDAFVYNAILERVVDGDTVYITLDLGFNTFLSRQCVRLAGIDTPESRINIKRYPHRAKEKVMGKVAKEKLKELCAGKFKVKSLGKGKYGRILGIPYTEDGKDICQILIGEDHAVEYHGGKKSKVWGE